MSTVVILRKKKAEDQLDKTTPDKNMCKTKNVEYQSGADEFNAYFGGYSFVALYVDLLGIIAVTVGLLLVIYIILRCFSCKNRSIGTKLLKKTCPWCIHESNQGERCEEVNVERFYNLNNKVGPTVTQSERTEDTTT